MKKLTQLLLLAGFLFVGQCFVYGQPGKIARQHLGSITTFTDLTAAIAASVSGDTLYLPGGTVYASGTNITIDKSLTVIGAGHYPDSTVATYQTIFGGTIYINTGADGGMLTGVKCGTIRFGSIQANQNINNFRIVRCYITAFYASVSGQSASQNILISESILYGCSNWNSNYFSSVLFEKSIIHLSNSVDYGGPAVFNNCIFYTNYNFIFANPAANVLNNCIVIVSVNSLTVGGTATILNNLLVSAVTPYNPSVTYNGTVNNTITKESASTTFVNANNGSFSYANNYHLNPGSNGHNAGNDGTDVGIYGTLIPYKEAAVPFNPHISSKTIGGATNSTGTLNVDIKVSAQDR